MADLLQIAKDYMAAWSSGDRDKMETYYADDAVFVDILGGGDPVEGRAAIRKEVIDGFHDPCPGNVWTPLEYPAPIVSADGVAIAWTFEGTNANPWPDGTEASGKPFKIKGATMFRFNDAGKITQYIDFIDYMNLSKAMGWVEE